MERLHALLEADGATALVVVARSSRDPCIAPFVGDARLGPSVLVCARGGRPHLAYLTPLEREEAASTGLDLLSPETLDIARFARDGAPDTTVLTAVLERALQHAGCTPGRVLLAGHAPAGTLAVASHDLRRDGWRIDDGSPTVSAWRKAKSARDVDEVRRVSAAVCGAFRLVARLLAASWPQPTGALHLEGEALRVGTLRARVARFLGEHGLEQPEGNLIAPGRTGAVPHNTGQNDEVVHAGQSLIVDLFPRGRLFSDASRTFCVGPPPDALRAAHGAVLGALETARRAARPGGRAFDLQRIVCDRFRAAGYANPIDDPGSEHGYVHGLGHGVGYEVHEQPSFRDHVGAAGVLEVGDVFTLEPGLYDPAAGWAVRLEDTCHLGEGGVEVLTPLPYDLDPARYGSMV